MRTLLIPVLLMLVAGCEDGSKDRTPAPERPSAPERPPTLFQRMPAERSGLVFANTIVETNEGNFSKFQYMYNGNGVAVGDVNGDGLADIYVTGNQLSDHLYLNQGGMRFLDISTVAGIDNGEGWKTGVCMVDIDADGDLDIHVARSGWYTDPEIRRNLLYVNEGNGSDGMPRFVERAAEWGIDDPGHSVHAAFSDLDNDGDLDLYLTNHPVDYKQTLEERIENMRSPESHVTDRLYRNDGDHFTDVSLAAGILNYGHGLGLMVWDFNDDGLDDIYVANDFQSPDYLYINRGGLRFREALAEHFPHVSYFSMGMDVNDFDNDGDEDLYVVEMLPWVYKREVMNLADMDEYRYNAFVDAGFHHQVMRNVLQMDQGNGHFGDVGWLTGTADTDWSWTALFADLDNDGWKDLLVTNGYLRDTQDKDYKKREVPFIQSRGGRVTREDLATICHSVKIPNRVYQNRQGHRFDDVATDWGLGDKAFSYGAAHADLDNDGDLDLVIANTNLTLAPDPTFIYENRAVQQGRGHWLRVRFAGPKGNPFGEGARVELRTQAGPQWQQLRFTRGFQSSVEPVVHFGLGEVTTIDSLIVRWPDGREQLLTGVPADTLLTVRHADAGEPLPSAPAPASWAQMASRTGIDHTHREGDFDDYTQQPQLPERLSRGGPCLAVADVNGDGRDDLFAGGGAGQPGKLFLAAGNGSWRASAQPDLDADATSEDRCAVFLDADGDGDPDLYVGSGSTEFTDEARLRDRLYLNEGGRFRRSDVLPPGAGNTGAVCAADVDGDGDMDLFVGGRSVPGNYPVTPASQLLRNEGGRFTTNTPTGLAAAGMVTAATFLDADGDGDPDLAVALDWGPVRMFRNDGGLFTDATGTFLDRSPTGWWRALLATDVDGDGDLDLLAGNYGENQRYSADAEHPVQLHHGDFDHNGSRDIVISRWREGAYRPDASFTYLRMQFPFLQKKYEWYEDYARDDMVRIFGVDLDQAERYTAETFSSVWYRNEGGRFTLQALPWSAQVSTVNAFTAFAHGGRTHVLLAGNTDHAPVEAGDRDAGVGLALTWANGEVRAVEPRISGIYLPGVVRGLATLQQDGRTWLVAGVNGGPMRVHRLDPPPVP